MLKISIKIFFLIAVLAAFLFFAITLLSKNTPVNTAAATVPNQKAADTIVHSGDTVVFGNLLIARTSKEKSSFSSLLLKDSANGIRTVYKCDSAAVTKTNFYYDTSLTKKTVYLITPAAGAPLDSLCVTAFHLKNSKFDTLYKSVGIGNLSIHTTKVIEVLSNKNKLKTYPVEP